MIAIIRTVLGFIAPFIDRIFGKGSEKALELKAQKELEELRAFRSGRVTPRFLLFYTLVGIFTIFSILFIISLFFPELVRSPELAIIHDLVETGKAMMAD